MKYIAPKYKKTSFTCPHCGVLAEQKWSDMYISRLGTDDVYSFSQMILVSTNDASKNKKLFKEVAVATCISCYNENIWFDGEMIIPKESNVQMPIEEMPEEIKKIYNEAREVFPISPKASAALLRLALQHLCVELGERGENINKDIGELVKKGLPIQIQQALDVVRVAGNNAVHPGVLDLEDDSTSAGYLFNILNMIVDNQIVQPKKVNEFYNSLPQTALDSITRRDS